MLNKDSITKFWTAEMTGRTSLPCLLEVFGDYDHTPSEEKYCFCSSQVRFPPVMPLKT